MSKLFLCEQQGYFTTKPLKAITVHEECERLAMDLCYHSLSDTHYEDIQYHEELTADEIEELIDEPDHYFVNYEEILRGFYRDGLISDELLQDYELDYISYGNYDSSTCSFEFPSEPLEDRNTIVAHVKKLWKTPVKIITVEEMHSVQKIKTYDGKLYPNDRTYSRNIMLNNYAPEGRNDLCFCQMCRTPKPKGYIEVNNIEILPEYFFSELRITLCLECSKKFEALRRNDSIRNAFVESIIDYDIYSEGTVDIP